MPFYSLYDGGDTNTAVAANVDNTNLFGHQDNTAVASAGSIHGSEGHSLVSTGDINTAVALNVGNFNLGGHQDNTAVASAGSIHGLPLH